MKEIFTYVAKYKAAAVFALFLMAIELVVELIQPVIMAAIIDTGVTQHDIGSIGFWGAVLLGISVLAFASGILNSFFASKVSQGTAYDLRKDVYERIQHFSVTQIQRFAASSLITRLTADVTQIQSLIFMAMRIMLRAPLFIIGGVIMAFTVNVRLALILAAFVPFLLLIMFFLMTKGVKLFGSVQGKIDRLNAIIQENLLGIRLVKAFLRSTFEATRFRKVNHSLMEVNKRALQLMETVMPLVMLGMNTGIIAILWFGSVQMEAGDAQPGEVVAILNYATRILGSFGVFSFLLMNFSRGKASAARITEVLLEQPEERLDKGDQREQKLSGQITFDEVSFRYPKAKQPALMHVSFSVEAGEVVGVIGETGSGKSTLVQLIPGLFPVTLGSIYFDERPIESIGVQQLRRQIGIVPQQAHLFSGTIRENLLWGNEEASNKEIIQAAEDASIHDYIISLPHGYDTVIGQRGINLSGGQKQRLSLARALVREPKILILDDSTSALDANTEAKVLQALRRRSCTVFIIASKISSVKSAEQILLLKHGELEASGPHHELIKQNAYYRTIYQSQSETEVFEHAGNKW
ncbi:ABC transporter ATP-binding protein [Sediminibacillus halophilus]|uniref:ATP-binding cassette, subfamily B n=1 Tax=Sediminibacillus halophilus TaxID=482461 RepID=A0A1G9TJ34_9BACI|nr:ABC transporter ATP-binding protein [Sediminibacillus halophilus]SDM47642.1 ATP-binding cassette, subfamily B [Sediminibacillus halophilus]